AAPGGGRRFRNAFAERAERIAALSRRPGREARLRQVTAVPRAAPRSMGAGDARPVRRLRGVRPDRPAAGLWRRRSRLVRPHLPGPPPAGFREGEAAVATNQEPQITLVPTLCVEVNRVARPRAQHRPGREATRSCAMRAASARTRAFAS